MRSSEVRMEKGSRGGRRRGIVGQVREEELWVWRESRRKEGGENISAGDLNDLINVLIGVIIVIDILFQSSK